MNQQKGQIFTFDYIIGFVMFIIVVVIAGFQLINILPSTSYATLYEENIYLSNTILQPGYPLDWTPSNVLVPGIADNGRLDTTKLLDFRNFTYDQTKSFLHISNDYLFYFQDKNGVINMSGCIFGFSIPTGPDCAPQMTVLGYNNLVKTNRLIIYNSTIIEMVLYSWN